MTKETVSFGSQPQKRPHADSAQMAPKTTPSENSGNAQMAVRYAIVSRAFADGSGRTTAPTTPVSVPGFCHMRSTYSSDAMPDSRKMEAPTITVETWIGNQMDCSAGTTGADSA